MSTVTVDPVLEASRASFPASDPPAWSTASPPRTDQCQFDGVGHLVLHAKTARDLMEEDLVSIRADSSLVEACSLLTTKKLNAVPVVDEAGHPVGVISMSDLLTHAREYFETAAMDKPTMQKDSSRVSDIMTPAVFSVLATDNACHVVKELLDMNVQQLFVVDEANLLIGAISAFDILKKTTADCR